MTVSRCVESGENTMVSRYRGMCSNERKQRSVGDLVKVSQTSQDQYMLLKLLLCILCAYIYLYLPFVSYFVYKDEGGVPIFFGFV